MIRRFNAHLDRVYSGVDRFRQQKAMALAWVCLVSLIALVAILITDILGGLFPPLFYLETTGVIAALVAAMFFLVTSGLLGRDFDWLLLALAAVHIASSTKTGFNDLPQGFYSGYGLYSPCVVLAASAFGRRWVFLSVAVLELGWTLLYGVLFLHPDRSSFEAYYRVSQFESFASLLMVCAMAWGFVAVVDRALRMFQEELDINRQLREDLERKVEARTADLEAARRAAQSANLAKSAFLADVSHEIRTPLNGILGMSDLLRDTELSADQREKVGILRESGTHLLGLIQDILDHAKIEEGRIDLRPEPTALRAFLRSTLEPLRETGLAKGVPVVSSVGEDLPAAIHVDPLRLRQILTNLVGNALKFTDAGEVAVHAVAVAESGSMRLKISVRDTGIGMDPDALSRIFRRFAQADETTSHRFGGTGLGLVISRGLARAMGGDLRAESVLGKGSTFVLDLPLVAAEAASPPDPKPTGESRSRLAGTRILLVEDDRTSRKVAEGLLARLGCFAEHCEDGSQALERLAGESFDLVLMDCQMPRMDGYDATRTIRSWENDPSKARDEASRIPIVALTASATEDVRSRCIASGMDEVLTKPLDADRLRKILEIWLRKES